MGMAVEMSFLLNSLSLRLLMGVYVQMCCQQQTQWFGAMGRDLAWSYRFQNVSIWVAVKPLPSSPLCFQ